ncbi:MAG TPA: FlgD immunoglobulin-like domain containing protein [Solirubrobacteraceae bacterium]
MSRLPVASFLTLIVASVGAFFITQHLKVTTPLIASPQISPQVINPLAGKTCAGTDHRQTTLSFSLLYRADDVNVYVVDRSGEPVSTLATGRHVRKSQQVSFVWKGLQDNGSLAPDGIYHFRVALIHQGRTSELPTQSGAPRTVTLTTVVPHPVVDGVSPRLIPARDLKGAVIRYSGNENRGGTIVLYRTDLPGLPRRVKSFPTPWHGQIVVWDGRIHEQPAPAGIYLVGLDVTDAACNTGHFPIVNPPPPGTTPHAGVTVRYLAAQPQLEPVAAGSRATVYVDSRQHLYNWTLTRAGARKPAIIARSDDYKLSVPVRASGAGLYAVALGYRSYRTAIPLVASSPRPQRVLVVLPALTWQGLNPGDDDRDGLPDTLAAGFPVSLTRPLADGIPGDVAAEAALLEYLDRFHRPYDLTTDVGLIEGVGPALAGHVAVVLAGSERWAPSSLLSALRTYVLGGGHVLSMGLDSLRSRVDLKGGVAMHPSAQAATDALGAGFGPLAQNVGLITAEPSDGLGIFTSTSGALTLAGAFEPITGVSPPGQIASRAVTSSGAAPIVGYRLGRGIVVDVALKEFASSLARNVNAQEVLSRIWTVLSH